jgi:hypothetical protein
MYFWNAKSMSILNMKKAHAVFGYIIVLLCKSDYFIILSDSGGFWALLIQDVIFLILIITWKLKFPRMESKTTEIDAEVEVKCVLSIK